MPLISKEIQDFYLANKNLIDIFTKKLKAYEKELENERYKKIQQDTQIMHLTEENKDIDDKIKEYEKEKNKSNKKMHKLLIDIELLLDPILCAKLYSKKKASIRFQQPEDKKEYSELITRYEVLKENYQSAITTNSLLLKKCVFVSLIDIRKQMNFSEKFRIYSAEKKQYVKPGLTQDIDFLKKTSLDNSPNNIEIKNILTTLEKIQKDKEEKIVKINKLYAKFKNNQNLIQGHEHELTHAAEKELQETKNAIRKQWLKLIEISIKHNIIESHRIVDIEELQDDLKKIFLDSNNLETKENFQLASTLLLTWREKHPLTFQKICCFPAFITMNALASNIEYKHINEKEKFSLLKEAYLKLFYLEEKHVSLLISLSLIDKKNPGFSQILKAFLNKSNMEVTIDINELITKLIKHLEQSLTIAQEKLILLIPKNMGLTQKNHAKIKKIFEATLLSSAPIIEKNIKKVFLENKSIHHFTRHIKNNLTDEDFTHSAEIIAKQTLYRSVLHRQLVKYLEEGTYIKGKKIAGQTKTLFKIAVLNDFISTVPLNFKENEEKRFTQDLKKLLEQLNVSLKDEVFKKIFLATFGPSNLFDDHKSKPAEENIFAILSPPRRRLSISFSSNSSVSLSSQSSSSSNSSSLSTESASRSQETSFNDITNPSIESSITEKAPTKENTISLFHKTENKPPFRKNPPLRKPPSVTYTGESSQ